MPATANMRLQRASAPARTDDYRAASKVDGSFARGLPRFLSVDSPAPPIQRQPLEATPLKTPLCTRGHGDFKHVTEGALQHQGMGAVSRKERFNGGSAALIQLENRSAARAARVRLSDNKSDEEMRIPPGGQTDLHWTMFERTNVCTPLSWLIILVASDERDDENDAELNLRFAISTNWEPGDPPCCEPAENGSCPC